MGDTRYRLAILAALALAGCGDEPGRESGGGGSSGAMAAPTDDSRGDADATTTARPDDDGGDGSTSGSTSDNDLPSSTTTGDDAEGSTGGDAGTSGDGTSTGAVLACDAHLPPATCDLSDGGHVYCVAPGDTLTIAGHLEYGPGFPEGLPALGVGRPGLGYIAAADPMVCDVELCAMAVGTGNSALAGGKICEANFDHDVAGTVRGHALYHIDIAIDAPPGDYPFGFTANTGASVLSPDFVIRVVSAAP